MNTGAQRKRERKKKEGRIKERKTEKDGRKERTKEG